MGKRTEEDDTFLRKKTEDKQNSATTTISSEAEITRGIVWIKILKEKTLKKIQRDKPPD